MYSLVAVRSERSLSKVGRWHMSDFLLHDSICALSVIGLGRLTDCTSPALPSCRLKSPAMNSIPRSLGSSVSQPGVAWLDGGSFEFVAVTADCSWAGLWHGNTPGGQVMVSTEPQELSQPSNRRDQRSMTVAR